MTLAVQQGVSKAIGEGDVSKQMLKNLERFDGKDRSKCLEWISNVEVIAQHSKKSFREFNLSKHVTITITHFLFCKYIRFRPRHQGNTIGKLFGRTEHGRSSGQITQHTDATRGTVSDIQRKISTDTPNSIRRKSRGAKRNKTAIIDYVKKLPTYPRDKLLKKLARKRFIHQDSTRCIQERDRN